MKLRTFSHAMNMNIAMPVNRVASFKHHGIEKRPAPTTLFKRLIILFGTDAVAFSSPPVPKEGLLSLIKVITLAIPACLRRLKDYLAYDYLALPDIEVEYSYPTRLNSEVDSKGM